MAIVFIKLNKHFVDKGTPFYVTFGVDIQSRRLLILTGIKNLKEKRDKWVIIYDIKTEKLLYRV